MTAAPAGAVVWIAEMSAASASIAITPPSTVPRGLHSHAWGQLEDSVPGADLDGLEAGQEVQRGMGNASGQVSLEHFEPAHPIPDLLGQHLAELRTLERIG
ncbi:MAG: hypothetical protein ABR549_11155 [Mycobacteriales bacterium]